MNLYILMLSFFASVSALVYAFVAATYAAAFLAACFVTGYALIYVVYIKRLVIAHGREARE